MRKDLKSAINQTKDVEGQIRAALQTPQKRNKLWIITESDYDSGVYERFFNDNVVVKPAFDENGNGGCTRVVRIVKNILKSGETQRIIGIRDADYMYYVPSKFRYPNNIYHTDERDIEMMMLKAPSVIAALTAWNPLFPAKIAQVIPIACYMGLIRIWHVARDIHASIKKFHIACAWDFVSERDGGLEAQVRERGGGFSAGQAQRLSIARAIIAGAPILLLDEATSALDVTTERQVLRNIIQRKPNRTVIVTTHRPSVLNMCQRVYRVMQTKVTELDEEEASKMAMDF